MTLKKFIDENSLIRIPLLVFTNIVFVLIRLFFKKRGGISESIVLISLHKLGDTVFTIPAIREVVKKYSSNFTIICFDHSKKIYQQTFNDLNYLILDEEDFNFSGRLAASKARSKLKHLHPNIIIDLKGSIVSASLIFNAKCKKIYGINEIYYKYIYDKFCLIRTTPHQVDIYFDAIKTFIPHLENRFFGYPIEYNCDKTILIQPFAGWKSKEWGFVNFIKLYKKLSLDYNCAFIFPEGMVKPDVATQLECENVKVIETTTMELLFKTIDDCSLFISNDSGPLQIAALLRRPTFSIYGPTSPKFHLPFGEFHKYAQKILKCTPSNEKYCFADGGDSCPHNDCLELLDVDEIYIKITKFISELKESFNTDIKKFNKNEY